LLRDDYLGKNGKGFREVADDIKAAIASGELKAGQRLVEAQLCELFGVKRNMISEALHKLEHEGFVKITPHVGAVVVGFTRNDIEQIYDLLSVLDGLAVRLATPFITGVQLENLETLLERMEAADKPSLFARYNDDFHNLLCNYSENDRLVGLTENLRLGIKIIGWRSFYVPGQIATSKAEHREILQAMKENKPLLAERIMRDHIIDAKNRLIIYIQKNDAGVNRDI
jgi:DNA-binding GntR family transcriptional regulator